MKINKDNYFYQYLMQNKFVLVVFTILTVCFSTTLGLYVSYINSSDFSVNVWPEYITTNQYNHYTDKTGYKPKSSFMSTNEGLVSKLNTTSYDIMTPTDYTASALYLDEKILPIDHLSLQSLWEEWYIEYGTSSWIELYYSNFLDQNQLDQIESLAKEAIGYLEDIIQSVIPEYNYSPKKKADEIFTNNFTDLWNNLSNIYPIDEKKLSDIAIPYQMGDIKIVYNLTDPIVQKMFVESPHLIGSYESIEYIVAENNGTLLATKNMRDFMSLGLKATGHSVNDYSDSALDAAYDYLARLMPNTLLQQDDLARTVSQLDSWSVAYAFSGDFITGIEDEWRNEYSDIPWYEALLFTKPKEGTVVYFDTFVQGSNEEIQEITNSFLTFFSQPNVQSGSGSEDPDSASYYYQGGYEYIYYAPSNKYVYEGSTRNANGENAYQYFCNTNGRNWSEDSEYPSYRYLNPETLEILFNGMTLEQQKSVVSNYYGKNESYVEYFNTRSNNNYYTNNHDYVVSNNYCYNPFFEKEVFEIFETWETIPSIDTINNYFMSPNYTNLYYQSLIIETDLDGTDKNGNPINVTEEMIFNRPYPYTYENGSLVPDTKNANNNWTYDEMYFYDIELINAFTEVYNNLLAIQNKV